MFSFARMLYDQRRCSAFAKALQRAINPGSSVVLDIGTGTGFFAVLASRLGARRVYAVEPGSVINVAKQVAASNGCAEKIEFVQKLSSELELPEKADIIISDLRGSTPFKTMHIPSLIDARERLLAKDGVLIAHSDTVFAAIAEAPIQLQPSLIDLEANYGVDMGFATRMGRNEKQTVLLAKENLLTKPAVVTMLDYRTVREPNLKSEITFIAERDGIAYGIAVWFEVHAAEGISFATGPMDPDSVYATALFPLEEPVPICAEDIIKVAIRNCLTTDGDYVWHWCTQVCAKDGAAKAEFSQSTLLSALDGANLHKHSESFIPRLNQDGRIDRFILEATDGQKSIGEIAASLQKLFPREFDSFERALSRAIRVAEQRTD
jgi:protein arginine N-methyltransferase 1